MTAASKQAFDDFALVARVHATPALTKDLSHAKVDMKAHQGEILVRNGTPLGLGGSHR